MAFQQPQRQQPRPRSFSSNAPPVVTAAAPATAPQRQSPRQEPQDWILFSPAPASDTYDRTDSTVRSNRDTGQLSDLGSLETAAVSDRARERPDRHRQEDNGVDLEITRNNNEGNNEDDNATEDLDSLDDGLHAFNEPSINSSQRRLVERIGDGDTVLPTHDGLGMFPGSSSPVQEQFWQHERYNPKRRRHSLKRSSLQRKFEAVEGVENSVEDDKVERIEQWRMEQSRAILEEIEKETRRRRRRKSRNSTSRTQRTASNISDDLAPQNAESPAPASPLPPSPERLSFWERLTRSVIRNLMGIDDATLEFIFGEALPPEPTVEKVSPISELIDQAERTISNDGQLATATETWEERLLARIAKELGILLGHISEHPGAFTTYLRTQEPVPYAGLSTVASSPSSASRPSTAATRAVISSTAGPHFSPTLPHHHHHHHRHSINTTDPSLWGIDEEDEDRPPADHMQPSPGEAARLQREREYWERDLDVKMVFGFLRDRFSSSSSTPASQIQPRVQLSTARASLLVNSSPTNHSSSANPDSLRRAALIRHHHPLVSRNVTVSASQQTSQSRSRLINSPAIPLSPVLGRRPSCAAETESCASQSTKRSKTAHSGSSRNFWDIGGSAGGGSLGAWSVGWGEA